MLTAHSHDGYLEILVTTGPLGLAMLLVCFLALPAYWFLTGSTRENQALMVPAFAIWVFVMYQNLLETSFFDKDRQVWVIRSEEHTSELQALMRNSYAVF